MSRIGRMPITVPAGVDVKIDDANVISVKGPKGTLQRNLHKDMIVKVEGNVITVERPSEDRMHKSLHGLTRTLVNNMVTGVTEGFAKNLEINGVGYRVVFKGKIFELLLGYSHQVFVEPVENITFEVPSPNQIIVRGIDNQVVGQIAAEIREKRPPEPYKGKGIKYADEHIRRKEGKTGAKK